jgi:ABC-type lipoprotein release transport system permease subunit
MKRGLPLELFLGLRYLTARGSRTNLSLFVWIGVGGVFLGVAALIVVLAVMTGFQDGIRDRIISANPHLLVFQSGSGGLADAAGVVARVTTVPGVRAATPFVLQQALVSCAGWTSTRASCVTTSRRSCAPAGWRRRRAARGSSSASSWRARSASCRATP